MPITWEAHFSNTLVACTKSTTERPTFGPSISWTLTTRRCFEPGTSNRAVPNDGQSNIGDLPEICSTIGKALGDLRRTIDLRNPRISACVYSRM